MKQARGRVASDRNVHQSVVSRMSSTHFNVAGHWLLIDGESRSAGNAAYGNNLAAEADPPPGYLSTGTAAQGPSEHPTTLCWLGGGRCIFCATLVMHPTIHPLWSSCLYLLGFCFLDATALWHYNMRNPINTYVPARNMEPSQVSS